MIDRLQEHRLRRLIGRFRAVALPGPRQVGKTTLALKIARETASIYLDLESPRDLAKLSDPELYLSQHEEKLVILDEVHRARHCPGPLLSRLGRR